MWKIWIIFIKILLLKFAFATAPIEVLFIISSQDSSSYHRQLSANLRNDILSQSTTLVPEYTIEVRYVHEIFNHPGDWTLLTMLARLYDTQFTPPLINDRIKWIILCEDSTHIVVQPLLNQLSQLNHSEPLFLGFPLYDQEATIIHHFAYFENPKWFPYPMLRAGVIFTVPLLKSLAAVVAGEGINGGSKPPTRTTEFSIDPAHELARFILDNVYIKYDKRFDATANMDLDGVDVDFDDGTVGQRRNLAEKILPHLSSSASSSPSPSSLTTAHTVNRRSLFRNVRKIILRRASYICPKANFPITAGVHKGHGTVVCAMYAKPMDTTSCLPARREEIFFAIKTCHKFHKERIPIIEAAWAQYIIHKRYYSDIPDANIPTIDAGIPNAETGHCKKTLTILKLALKDIEEMNREMSIQSATVGQSDNPIIRWLVLADDDTLLSVSHLSDLLGCFNHTAMIYLGERYGYRLHAEDGFNYITGGGGIVFSLPVVQLILKHCTCPTTTSPDDMILGSCLHTLGIKAIHSSRFHQARPNDYPQQLLELEPPISFHKFWQLDPLAVYERWFATADREMLTLEFLQNRTEQRRKLHARLKMMNSINNKSRLDISNDAIDSCEKPHDKTKPVTANIAATNELPLAMESAFDHGSNSHLDL